MNEEKKTTKKNGAFIAIILILLVVLIGMVFFWIWSQSDEKNQNDLSKGKPETEEEVFAVNTTAAVLGPISDYFEINGEVVTASSVETYPDVNGILAELNVRIGDFVREGQEIAKVDPSRPGLVYALSPVKARISGTITDLSLDRGDAVSLQSSVATIGDLSRLQVITAIPERFISQIRLGMPAEVSLAAWPGQAIPMTVDELNPVVDAESRTMEIKLDVPQNHSMAQAGMYAEIRLTTDEKDAVVKIPADSILRRLGDVFVYVIEDDTAKKRIVVPGIILNDVVEIIEGLKEGEKIVYQGQTLLEDGVSVRVVRNVQVID